MDDSKLMNEVEPPLLKSWLDRLDKAFDVETAALLDAADKVIEDLRLEYERSARRYFGRPKRAA